MTHVRGVRNAYFLGGCERGRGKVFGRNFSQSGLAIRISTLYLSVEYALYARIVTSHIRKQE
jgi:hypothetical protein